jgi:hypothetical protein
LVKKDRLVARVTTPISMTELEQSPGSLRKQSKAYQKLDNLSIYKNSVTGIVTKNINQIGRLIVLIF